MSIHSVTQSPTISGGALPENAASPFEIGDLWKGRIPFLAVTGLTQAETTRLAIRTLGIGLVCTGIVAFSLAAVGVVVWPVGLISIPAVLIASALFWSSVDSNEYENPEAVERFRSDAARLDLEGVVQTYGWEDSLRFGILTPDLFAEKYRLQIKGKNLVDIINYFESTQRHTEHCLSPKYDYQIPSPRESAKLWRQETASKTFEEIIQTYPLEKLEKYAILESGELGCIKNLKRDYEVIRANYEREAGRFEGAFQNSTQTQKNIYHLRCALAQQAYDANEAVRQLQGFELGYARERQISQELHNRCKVECRARFDAAVAPLTDHGRVPYHQLPPAEKLRYEQHLHSLQLAESIADTEALQRIEQIDVRRRERLSQLNVEEGNVKQERERAIAAATQEYDLSVAPQREQKELQCAPIQAAFRLSASDFNGRYRAYLRIVGAL